MLNAHETIAGLARIQLRRKAAIVATALIFTPLLILASPNYQPGSTAYAVITGLGILAIIIAIIGRSWCTLYIGGRKASQLVTLGPYSIVRNPLYIFSFMGAWGLAAQTGSITISVITMMLAYAVFAPVVLKEETALSRLHGQHFEKYKKSVPRFIPRPSAWRDVEEMPVSLKRWRATVLDGSVLLLMVPLIRGISWLQSQFEGLPLVPLP